ncbi:hypothetical protein [Brevibacillus porteri]|uniref:hypothetical protein n=1 Tax=Brevibacillus porteri TaxID=2126350 RepID=UPI003628781A
MNLLKSRNWFLSPYSIVPQQPITLLDKLDHLWSVWNNGDEDELRELRAKGWFPRSTAMVVQRGVVSFRRTTLTR